MAWFDSGYVEIYSFGTYSRVDARIYGNADRSGNNVRFYGGQEIRIRNTAGGSSTLNNPIYSSINYNILGSAAIKGTTSGNIAGNVYARGFDATIAVSATATNLVLTGSYSGAATGSMTVNATFAIGATAPTASWQAVSNIKHQEATVNANVSNLNGNSSATITWYYRVSGASSWTNAGSNSYSGTGVRSKTFTGLQPDTVYQYYATVAGNVNGTTTMATQTFSTIIGAQVISPDGTVKKAVPYVIDENGAKEMTWQLV